MSTVVAVKEQSRVYIGSDTMASSENGSAWYDKTKIWQSSSNKNILVGGVGFTSVIEQVRHGYPFDADNPTLENVNAWIQDIISKFKDVDNYSFLICGNGKIFLATGCGLVIEANSYEAIGSGRDVALGALFTINKFVSNPDEKIRTAISASMRYDLHTGGKIIVEMI